MAGDYKVPTDYGEFTRNQIYPQPDCTAVISNAQPPPGVRFLQAVDPLEEEFRKETGQDKFELVIEKKSDIQFAARSVPTWPYVWWLEKKLREAEKK